MNCELEVSISPHPPNLMGFPGDSVVKNPPANAGDMSAIPGVRKIPWKKGCSNPLLRSCLGNPMDRGACHGQRATVHRVTESDMT